MIDKFNRLYVPHYLQYNPQPRGGERKPYEITVEGDTDWKRKRLRNVDDPERDRDVVNKKYLKTEIGRCVNLNNDQFDAKGKVISNVADPIKDEDITNKKYVNTEFNKCMSLNDKNEFDAKNKVVSNIAKTDLGNAAVSNARLEEYVNSNCLHIKNDHYSAEGKKIMNVIWPTVSHDAVNKHYVDHEVDHSLRFNRDKTAFNARTYAIKYLGDPTDPSDAVTLNYLRTKYPTKEEVKTSGAGVNLDDYATKENLKELSDIIFEIVGKDRSFRLLMWNRILGRSTE